MGPRTLIAAYKRCSHDQVPLLAAGVAFYGFLGLFPALIAGVLLYGLVASPETVAEQSAKLFDALPSAAATLITEQMDAITSTAPSSLGVGFIAAVSLALWSAAGGVGNLVTAINKAFGCEETRSFIHRKVLALGLTIGAVVFVLIAISLVALAPVVFDAVDDIAPLRFLLEIARWVVLFLVIAGALTILYRVAPDRHNGHTNRAGVFAATAIWMIASLGFSLYVDNFSSYGKTYGALAGVVALLLWLWVSAYAILFGAVLEAITSPSEEDSAADYARGMRDFYPDIEPFDTGLLDVGNGQQIYYEISGNPDGKPAVYLHGGPGGASSPKQRRVFDPAKYRIVLFDQRGCGNSLPHASAPEADLSANTTWHLVADIEALRTHLGIDRWLVCGGSWGSALGLAYAEKHPESVSELVLRGIFTLRKSELDWFYEGGAGAIYPDLWEGFLAPVPEEQRHRLIEAYSRLLNNPDPAVHQPAAKAWARWESSTITLLQDPELIDHFTEDDFAVAFARIENHFFMNAGWYDDGQLIRDAVRLKGIPGVIIQGRYDMCTPAFTAWDLHKAWPEAEFKIIPDAGHAFSEPGIRSAIIEATDAFAS